MKPQGASKRREIARLGGATGSLLAAFCAVLWTGCDQMPCAVDLHCPDVGTELGRCVEGRCETYTTPDLGPACPCAEGSGLVCVDNACVAVPRCQRLDVSTLAGLERCDQAAPTAVSATVSTADCDVMLTVNGGATFDLGEIPVPLSAIAAPIPSPSTCAVGVWSAAGSAGTLSDCTVASAVCSYIFVAAPVAAGRTLCFTDDPTTCPVGTQCVARPGLVGGGLCQ